MSCTQDLKGIFASLITPFGNDKILLPELEKNITILNSTPIKGFLVLGGNAESMGMSEKEKRDVLKTVIKKANDKIIIGGIACESTYKAIEQAKQIADIGADYLRILPPYYFASKMTPEIIENFYEEVAEGSPIPFILYNVPRLTGGVALSPSTVSRLSTHPKIVGIKDSSPDGIYGFLAATRNSSSFSVLAGSANIFFPGLVAGACGGDMTLANYLPAPCCDLLDAFNKGDMEKAKQLHLSLFTINKLVSGKYGVAGIKTAMNLLGFHGGEPRRPFFPLSGNCVQDIRRAIEEEGFI